MIYLRAFNSVSAMNAYAENSETDFMGLAYEENNPKMFLSTIANNHPYVEIGDLKWATMNVGATSETDYGLYFQWGDTQGYTADQVGSSGGGDLRKEPGDSVELKYFSWDDYKFGTEDSLTKYNDDDGLTELELEDDAVHAAWGGDWRMPSSAEFQNLLDNTTNEWVVNYNGSGINGVLFTDNNDSSKTLFFPASGACYEGSVHYVGDRSVVWGSSLSQSYTAYVLYSSMENPDVNSYENLTKESTRDSTSQSYNAHTDYGDAPRCTGFAVRGVSGELPDPGPILAALRATP